jgi:DNA-binding transcriptional LysR family regulator
MDVHLRDLRYFAAVAEELHYSRAAQRLHVTQPTLTRQIQQLQRQLRVTLFERVGRTMVLTPAGNELLVVAREVLGRWQDGVGSVTSVARTGQTLRIGLHTAIGRGVAVAIGERFARRLTFRQYPWNDPTAGLGDGEVDAAFVWLPLPDAQRFAWHVIRTEARWVIMSASHPLAGRSSVALADLREEPFVALPAEAGVSRSYWLADDERDRPATVVLEASTPDEKVEAIAAGVGVCLVAEGNTDLYRRPGLAAVPVTDLSPAQLVIAWAAHDKREQLRDLVSLVAQAYTDEHATPGR